MGIKISTITIYELREEFKQFSDESIYWLKNDERNLNIFNKLIRFFILLKKVLKKKYSILIGVTSNGNYFPALIFFLLRKKAKKRIYFPYDIAYFRYKDYKTYPWYTRWSEKYNFRCCDGIIHKGPEDELKYLPKEFKALEKPSLQFLPYCDQDAFVPIDDDYFERKLSKKDGETHLVYVGGVYHHDKAQYDTIGIFLNIVAQKIHIHVYTQKYESLINDSGYNQLIKSRYFHLHKPIFSEDFQREISKYDWGVLIFYTNFSLLKKEWALTAFSNKIASYLESGLPIIVLDEMKFISDTVTNNKFGIKIKNESEIKNMTHKTDYRFIVENIIKQRGNYSLKFNKKHLIDFMEAASK